MRAGTIPQMPGHPSPTILMIPEMCAALPSFISFPQAYTAIRSDVEARDVRFDRLSGGKDHGRAGARGPDRERDSGGRLDACRRSACAAVRKTKERLPCLAHAAYRSSTVWVALTWGGVITHPPLTCSFLLALHRINGSAVSRWSSPVCPGHVAG